MTSVAACLFTAVFAAALFAKLDSWDDWAAASEMWFDAPAARTAVRRLVPAAEAATLVALVGWKDLGLALSAAVLAVFAAGAGMLAARGVDSACACFGTASPSRIGFPLAIRNTIFAAGAGAAFATASAGGPQSFAAVLTALLLVTSFLLFQERRSLERVAGVDTGRRPPRWIPGMHS
jgi:hypothetical protein